MPTKTSCGISSMAEQFDMFPSNVVPFGPDKKPLHSSNQGYMGECYVHYILGRNGVASTIVPYGGDYDLIADFQNQLIKIQVKTSGRAHNIQHDHMSFTHTKKIYNSKMPGRVALQDVKYKTGDYDILALYSLPHGLVFFRTLHHAQHIAVPKATFKMPDICHKSWKSAVDAWRLTDG
jgi:hypothetical protein